MQTLECTDGQKQAEHEERRVVVLIVILLIVALQVGAIVSAAKGKSSSSSFSADILLSVFSPVMYWILKIFKVIGTRAGVRG